MDEKKKSREIPITSEEIGEIIVLLATLALESKRQADALEKIAKHQKDFAASAKKDAETLRQIRIEATKIARHKPS